MEILASGNAYSAIIRKSHAIPATDTLAPKKLKSPKLSYIGRPRTAMADSKNIGENR